MGRYKQSLSYWKPDRAHYCRVFGEDDHRWPLKAKRGDKCWCGLVKYLDVKPSLYAPLTFNPSLYLNGNEIKEILDK